LAIENILKMADAYVE